MSHAQNKKQFFQKQQNQILSFQNLFILTKYHMFWLSYECFSILCNAFLLSAISDVMNKQVKIEEKFKAFVTADSLL